MRIAITGSSGLVGSALMATGIEAVPFIHGTHWDWRSGRLDAERLRSCDALVHLAGAGIADRRWTAARRQEIRDSRVQGTALFAQALNRDPGRVRTLICASATGFYGDRGEEVLTEVSSVGSGFLAEVCRDWEAAAMSAPVRVVQLRLGMVLSPRGGALARMLPAVRWGLGGRLGDGRQWWSWIALPDLVALIHRAFDDPVLSGAVNAVSPQPLRQADFMRILARAAHRPCLAPPAPRWALRLALGGVAEGALLASAQVCPARLQDLGFAWQASELTQVLSIFQDT